MSGNAAEIRQLAKDFGKVSPKVVKRVQAIMPKTGLAMKKRLQADLRASSSFKAAARSVDYDVKMQGFGGDGLIQVEVGPNAARSPAAALAGIAYFGGSLGGGGTVPDPIVAMRLEESVFLGFLEMAVEGIL
jgi:hypothetical protein